MDISKSKKLLMDGRCFDMQVSYITLNASYDGLGGIIEGAVSNAISNCIVRPFQNWCYGIWCGIVDVSLPACTTTSLVALMLYMVGVKKARQWIIIPIIVYLFLQIADKMVR